MKINDPLKDMSPGERLVDFIADYSLVLLILGVMIVVLVKAVSTGSILEVILGAFLDFPLLLLILGIIHSRSRNHGDTERDH